MIVQYRWMARFSGFAAMLCAASLFSACVGHTAATPFVVEVFGTPDSCHARVAGREVAMQALPAIARDALSSARHAEIRAALDHTPYRCIGGVIYTLQSAGFSTVRFVAHEPDTAIPPR